MRRASSIWLAVLGFALARWIVFDQRWGPVVAVVSRQRRMGVHAGDVAGVAAFAVGLLALVVAVAPRQLPVPVAARPAAAAAAGRIRRLRPSGRR